MATANTAAYGEKCPNCDELPADVATYYDEVIAFTFASGGGFRYRDRSYSKRTRSGNIWLCQPCAAAYNRSVMLRQRGTKVANIGFVALLISAVLFLLLYNHAPSLHQGALILIPTAPVLLSLLAMLFGALGAVIGRLQRERAVRFLSSPRRASMAAPASRLAR